MAHLSGRWICRRATSRFVLCVGFLVGTWLGSGPRGVLSASEREVGEPAFSRHIVPLFSRLGCNSGACHGAVKGQNGFRLSLFGADPAADHERLVREFGGRRVDYVAPENSLLLRKACGSIAHRGGQRFDAKSEEYSRILSWIAHGCKLDDLALSKLVRLTVSPSRQTLTIGERLSLRAEAEFADGSREDVTALCAFEVVSKDLARVSRQGEVEALAVGDTAVIVRYRAEPAIAQLTIPRAGSEPFPQVVAHNAIDERIIEKLRQMNLHPAPLADDTTFLRRASLDVIGLPPTPDEIRSFVASTDPRKRQRKIDELLAHPGFAAVWATKFCDILRPTGFDGKVGFTEAAEARRVYEWVRARLLDNIPYDQFAERILLATSREERPEAEWVGEVQKLQAENLAKQADLKAYSARKTLDLYWQRSNATGVKGTLQVAHAFLGLRLECAQCHRHPHDVWQQDDLLSFANFFMRVSGPNNGGSSPSVVKQADELAARVKALKDEAKKLGDSAKERSLSKADMTRLQTEAKGLSDQAAALEAAGRRLKGSEVRTLEKPAFASVVSTLGKQESKEFRMLGERSPRTVSTETDPRGEVLAWLRRPDNPFFAKAIVNRVWATYFGRGLIEPADQLSPLNPASHPELLDELCQDFIKNGFDLKHLHRQILNSRTYQQSAQTNSTNRLDSQNYASFYLRRLPAEVLVDALNQATGGTETYPPELYLPEGARAVEVAGGAGSDRARATLQYAFQIFGRPLRSQDVQCDCERDTKPTIVQTLYLANHPLVQQKIGSPTGRVATLVKEISDDARRVDELYLWTLSRLPTTSEREACLTYLAEAPTPHRGCEDIMWSLINTKEFLLNH